MPILKIYNTAPNITLPINYPSRTVFRFYSANPDDNNDQININLGIDSAVLVIEVPDEDPIELDLTRKVNGDFILYLSPNQLSLVVGIYEYSIYLDGDYVPFVTGQLAMGNIMLDQQFIGILNASRNSIKVNEDILENPQFADSQTVTFSVETVDGVATVKATVESSSDLNPWTDQEYDLNDQVIFESKLWIAKEATLSTDVPGESDKWLVAGDQQKAADYPEADIDGALVWTGVAPSGTVTKRYVGLRTITGYTQIWFKIRASVAGSGNTKLTFPLPSAVPIPDVWDVQPNGEIVTFGGGCFTANGVVTAASSYIIKLADVYYVVVDQPYVSLAVDAVDLSVDYFS